MKITISFIIFVILLPIFTLVLCCQGCRQPLSNMIEPDGISSGFMDRVYPPVISCKLTLEAPSPESLVLHMTAANVSDADWYCNFGSGNDTYKIAVYKNGSPVGVTIYGRSFQSSPVGAANQQAAAARMSTFIPAHRVDKCQAELGKIFVITLPGEYDVRAERYFWTLVGDRADLVTEARFTVTTKEVVTDFR